MKTYKYGDYTIKSSMRIGSLWASSTTGMRCPSCDTNGRALQSGESKKCFCGSAMKRNGNQLMVD